MITFTFPTSDLLEAVKAVSAERVKALLLKNSNNPDLLDEATLTDDDNPNLVKYMKQGAQSVAGCLSGYTTDLLDEDGVTVLSAHEILPADTEADPPTVESVVFRINVPATFNNANVNIIDDAVQEAIVNYMLYRAYKNKGHDFETYQNDYDIAKNSILFYVNQRTGTAVKNYRLI